MSSYNKVKSQFFQFIKSLKVEDLTSHEKKLINLIVDNFDSVASTGTAGGRRATLLNELINQHRKTVCEELKVQEDIADIDSENIVGLNSLEVENFRGFAKKEIFDLNRPKVLVYGPNGSGKTSFCEALEYSLLGYLSEADAKRIDVTHYITNVHSRRFDTPIITGFNSNGDVVSLTSNVDKYYFSFIEKNRIIDFARYSSKTSGQQENLLATLFGLDDFYLFVKNFTDNIVGKIPIESIKQVDLDRKINDISGHRQNIQTSTAKLIELTEDKKLIELNSNLNKSFDELDLYINGSSGQKGRIENIDEELQKAPGVKITQSGVDQLFKDLSILEDLLKEFESDKLKFETEKDKISFRAIFELVKDFETEILDKCPVCETPLEQVAINPYDNARHKLEELKEIALIEQSRDASWEKLLVETYSFATSLESRNKCAQELEVNLQIKISEKLSRFQIDKSELNEFILDLKQLIFNVKANKDRLAVLEERIELKNTNIGKRSEVIASLQAEKIKLNETKKLIDELKSSIKLHQEIIENGQAATEAFVNDNKLIIDEIANEKIILEENKKFVESYGLLLQKLKNYKRELPLSLAANLNGLTKEFYNYINKDDNIFELIDKIQLPSNAGERIKIWFQDNPELEFDAMHILSEGHTRCLGLSILLAKVVNHELPVIIFDDVVNAIDHDHRGRIRELLFDNPIINQKQVIITSHSEEYIKDIENKHFTKSGYNAERILYVFLKPISKTIRKKETTRHYLHKASEHLQEHSLRDCLMECRRALENLSNDLWRKASKKYVFQITYKVRTPFLPPDLMGIVNSLRKELRSLGVSDFDKSLDVLTWLSGLETANNQIWNYLNKGTHEEAERDDFDQLIVEEVLKKLINLETELLQKKN